MFLLSEASQSFGSQSARLADRGVSGSSRTDLIGSQLLKLELLCCLYPHAHSPVAERLQACCFAGIQPQLTTTLAIWSNTIGG